ncbi:MAG: AI-2E family transporter [Roseiflexus sp.]|nr:AI-2E family transporter [Roseiflexus sp.]MCS7288746.1 AI-2E family transporter [Roseiflexus sp.]MDW8233587.1 AI-2E family transporter [Roseiflexaceae bacterium]
MLSGRLGSVALWLLIICAAVFLFERAVVVVSFFATPLLLFALAWLIAVVLQPLVSKLTALNLPAITIRAHSVPVPPRHLSRALSVALIYLALFAVLLVVILSFVPTVTQQLATLTNSAPATVELVVRWIAQLEETLGRFGFRGDLTAMVQPEAITQQLTGIGSAMLQQSLGIAGSIATVLFNIFLVLILSFYITLDGPRIGRSFVTLLPQSWRDEVDNLFAVIDRVFGGFMRAQFVNSLLYGIANAIVMALFGLSDIALASVVAAMLVFIPLVGGFFALIPPALIAILFAPDRVGWLLLALLAVQQVQFNVIMPRLVGQAIGLHPLLVFAALLLGGTVAGGWGVLFGIPVAGVIASIAQFFYERARRTMIAMPSPADETLPSASAVTPLSVADPASAAPVSASVADHATGNPQSSRLTQ